jgi:putative transcriptional regulator
MKVRLKELRKARRWTQDDLASRLGVSKSHVSEMESGKKNPSGPVLDRMSKLFDVPVPDLLSPDPTQAHDPLAVLIARFQAMGEADKAAILQMSERLLSRDG